MIAQQRNFFSNIIKDLWEKPLARWAFSIFAISLVLFLGTYHQPFYPATWIDEGFVEQGASNLIEHGLYAMRSSEGFRVFDQPLIANGPGVVLPVTASFALFGEGLLQARLVIVVFMLAAVVLFFVISKNLFGTPAALISTFFLMAVPGEGFIYYGRQVLGNVPAFSYFLAGYALLLFTITRKNRIYPIISGLCFGLAMTTKGQYMLLLPILIGVFCLDLFYYKRIGLVASLLILLTTGMVTGIWYLVQFLSLGWSGFLNALAAVQSSSHVTVMAVRPDHILSNLITLARSGIWLFVLPGWLFALWSCRQRSVDSVKMLLPVVFVPIWLGWFVFLSIGWTRYLFDAYMVGLLFSGYFIVVLYGWTVDRLQKQGSGKRIILPAGGILLLLIMVSIGAYSFLKELRQIVSPPDRSVTEFSNLLEQTVSHDAVVESWEWQMDVFTPLNYHHPENGVVDDYTGKIFLGTELKKSYDPLQYSPDYLVDGPFSKWTGVYAQALKEGCCTLVDQSGAYDLYVVNKGLH
jgi:4-amino-4-deoxy-L-arabinose transferase-like glycosyltransferase